MCEYGMRQEAASNVHSTVPLALPDALPDYVNAVQLQNAAGTADADDDIVNNRPR
jgi:hypothetical protein